MKTTTQNSINVNTTLPTNNTTRMAFNYQETYTQALKGSQMAVDALVSYLKNQASSARIAANAALARLTKDIEEARTAGRSTRRYDDPHIRRMVQVANNYGVMLNQSMTIQRNLKYGEEGVAANKKLLRGLKDGNALHTPNFGSFTFFDLQRILMGRLEGQGVPRRGMANLLLAGYGILTFNEQGVLLKMADNAYQLNTEKAHELVMGMDLATYQVAPFSQAGVFPTRGDRANYDGITFVARDVTLQDLIGEEIHFKQIRLSMEYRVYATLTYSVVFARYGEQHPEYGKYRVLSEVTEAAFGNGATLPQNKIEMERAWDLRVLLTRKTSDDLHVFRSEEEKAPFFAPGGMLARRGFTQQSELLNDVKYHAIIAQFEARQEAKREKRRADREARRAVNSSQVEETDTLANSELDNHPF